LSDTIINNLLTQHTKFRLYRSKDTTTQDEIGLQWYSVISLWTHREPRLCRQQVITS